MQTLQVYGDRCDASSTTNSLHLSRLIRSHPHSRSICQKQLILLIFFKGSHNFSLFFFPCARPKNFPLNLAVSFVIVFLRSPPSAPLSFHLNHHCWWHTTENIKYSHLDCYQCPIYPVLPHPSASTYFCYAILYSSSFFSYILSILVYYAHEGHATSANNKLNDEEKELLCEKKAKDRFRYSKKNLIF